MNLPLYVGPILLVKCAVTGGVIVQCQFSKGRVLDHWDIGANLIMICGAFVELSIQNYASVTLRLNRAEASLLACRWN